MGSVILKTLLGILAKMGTEEFVKWAFYYLGRLLVESTKTPHDDVWLDKLEGIEPKEEG